jgi:hypothetical protein
MSCLPAISNARRVVVTFVYAFNRRLTSINVHYTNSFLPSLGNSEVPEDSGHDDNPVVHNC